MGLTFLRNLTEVTGGRDAWPEGVRMQDLSYYWKDRKSRRRAVRGARKRELIPRDIHWSKIPMVRLTLGPHGYDPLPCTVLWDPKPERPDSPTPVICVDFGEPETRPGGAWVDTASETAAGPAEPSVVESEFLGGATTAHKGRSTRRLLNMPVQTPIPRRQSERPH